MSGKEQFINQYNFDSGIVMGDDPAIMELTPQDRVYVAGWYHACPMPDEVVEYYGNAWLEWWKKQDERVGLEDPTPDEILQHGLEITCRRYSECNFVFGYVLDRIRVAGKDSLHLALVAPTHRLDDEPVGYYEKGRVPETHDVQMSAMSTLVGYALPRVIIEQYGWGDDERSWGDSQRTSERYLRGLDIIDEAIAEAETPAKLLALISEGVVAADARADKVLGHILADGILKEENNHTEFKEVRQALQEFAPSLREMM